MTMISWPDQSDGWSDEERLSWLISAKFHLPHMTAEGGREFLSWMRKVHELIDVDFWFVVESVLSPLAAMGQTIPPLVDLPFPGDKPRGHCSVCGRPGPTRSDGTPYPHKSGNPGDWFGQSAGRFITNQEMQWCRGEGLPAEGIGVTP